MSSVRALREVLGHEAMAELHLVVDRKGQEWKEDVLTVAGERFERKLAEEMCALRLDMARECAAIRADSAGTRAELMKWSFLFWIGQFGAVSAMVAFLLRTMGPR